MNTDEALLSLDSLLIYDFKGDAVVSALRAALSCKEQSLVRKCAKLFAEISAAGSLSEHLAALILQDDNVFSKAAAAGKEDSLPAEIKAAVSHDIKALNSLRLITPADIAERTADDAAKKAILAMPAWNNGNDCFPFNTGDDALIAELAAYHRKNGYGIFSRYKAFTFKEGHLQGITATDPITLYDLKGYDDERGQVVENTLHFLNGLPANNVLLYGDRGTGKSSTVHAILNEYASRGLRMVEVSKSEIQLLGVLREIIADCPLKFIIFIDDLSFDSYDDSFGSLKAMLEGSLSGKNENALIYATSNRRHLIKEKFSDRENDINRNDVMQEQLSLSDRFGLVITFINPGRKLYLEIVRRLADDRKLQIPEEELYTEAERWATKKGGRSPRFARQLIDRLESIEKYKDM